MDCYGDRTCEGDLPNKFCFGDANCDTSNICQYDRICEPDWSYARKGCDKSLKEMCWLDIQCSEGLICGEFTKVCIDDPTIVPAFDDCKISKTGCDVIEKQSCFFNSECNGDRTC